MSKQGLIDYLKKRGISKKTAMAFDLCLYTKDMTFLGNRFPVEKFLTRAHKDSILFPIYDVYGNLLGISSKSPEGLGYRHKGTIIETLFGLFSTWRYIVKNNVAVIVEGNFDTLKCYEKGVKYIVGLLGAHANFQQVCLLRRFTSRCIIALDGDRAGRRGSEKLEEQLKELDFDYKILELPDGEDPDSFLTKYSAKEFLRLVR